MVGMRRTISKTRSEDPSTEILLDDCRFFTLGLGGRFANSRNPLVVQVRGSATGRSRPAVAAAASV